VTSTPLARPLTIPEEPEHVDEPSAPPSSSPPASPPAPSAAIPEEPRRETVKVTGPTTPPSSPPRRTEPTSPLFGLQTPPRRPQFAHKLEFKTPSPPHNMPDLPGPPSSDEEMERTPSKSYGSMNGNLTAIKTPRPPGAWALTPVPVQKPVIQPKESASTPDLATAQETLQHTADVTVNKTPAPPGAWQATPAPDSLRKKGILKVRFDVESNASGDTTLDEIPLVGPRSPHSKPGDSISEVFPPLPVEPVIEKSQKSRGSTTGKDNDVLTGDRPTTPPSLHGRSKSSGVRVLDAFGRETVQAADPVPGPSTLRTSTEVEKGKGKEVVGPPSPRSRSAVRIVDAMGHEVAESEMSTAEDSAELPEPKTRSEALRRIRQTVSTIADEFSDNEE
jgi:serine/arginine repetitive matrix protein 2